MIPLPPDRAADLVAFLRADLPGAVFPLVNLTPAGLPMQAFVAPGGAGAIGAFLGLTEGGMALPVGDSGGDWAGARAALAGRAVTGMLGRPAAVAALRTALGLTAAPVRKDEVEAGFDLPLPDLRVPPTGATLEPLTSAGRDLACAWRAAYEVEVLGTPRPEATTLAPAAVDRWIAQRSHRLLLDGGVPVAMTGFNADLGDTVQVGGVYVPPALRNRGLARRAVALHLAEARDRGAQRAVLFAVSDAAARAYAAIGFRPSGSMALVLFDGPQRVAP